jgi:hypothetical protein
MQTPSEAEHSPTKSAWRINRLAKIQNAQQYLEIGVAGGNTFHSVQIQRKHAVDPKFRFDTSHLATEDVRYFEIPSDQYFSQHVPHGMKFDIVLLDGLHTFEQTFRDFCASTSHAHPDTIWIIDDVFPSDIFSALRSQKEAIRHRREHGLKGRLWHGDVFKCIFAIHDFSPISILEPLTRRAVIHRHW